MADQQSFDAGPSEIDEAMPAPLLMNCWKHHARTILARIDEAVAGGEAAVRGLPDPLRQIGGALMDLYLGELGPAEIARQALARLEGVGVGSPEAYGHWLATTGGYATIDLSDGSRWVLRESPLEGRHIHVHPGRYSPHSVRVRAAVLKTAIATLAWAALRDLDPMDVATVNEARVELLQLSPVKMVGPDEGLGELMRRLRGVRVGR